MKKFFGYVRVSTVKQGEHGVSLEQQREAIERYAEKNSLSISRWFTEQETAAKRGRPVFGQMLKLLRQRAAVGVIIHKIDRSARNLKDWADLGELIDSGMEVFFANESLDLASRGGRLSADIQAVVAADYIRNLREETKKGFYGRLKQGLYPRPAPIGYKDQGPGKLKLVDHSQAPLVREAFNLYATRQYNLKELADTMFQRGLRSRSGGKVKHQPMANILSNPFYMGVIKVKKVNESFQGSHEPIVQPSLFNQVQDILGHKSHKKTIKHEFLFRQLFTCKPCKRYLVPERQKAYVYYRCHGKACPSSITREEVLEQSLTQKLKLLEFSQEEKDYFRTRLQSMKQSWQTERHNIIQGLKLSINQLTDRQNRLTDAYLDQALDKDSFQQRKTALLTERCELEQRLKDLQQGTESLPEKLQSLLELAGSAYLAYKAALPHEKRELVQSLSSNRSLDGKTLTVEMKFPFHLVIGRQQSCRGCPTRVSGLDVKAVWDRLMPKLLEAVALA